MPFLKKAQKSGFDQAGIQPLNLYGEPSRAIPALFAQISPVWLSEPFYEKAVKRYEQLQLPLFTFSTHSKQKWPFQKKIEKFAKKAIPQLKY